MTHDEIHDLAIVYANSKLAEYQIDSRSAVMCGNTEMSVEEIQYLKSAYQFALNHLTEQVYIFHLSVHEKQHCKY